MDTHALLLLLRELAVDVAGQQFTHMVSVGALLGDIVVKRLLKRQSCPVKP